MRATRRGANVKGARQRSLDVPPFPRGIYHGWGEQEPSGTYGTLRHLARLGVHPAHRRRVFWAMTARYPFDA